MKPVKPTAAVPPQTFAMPPQDAAAQPQNLAALQAVIGIRNARKLCRAFGGSTLYIPKLEGVDRPSRNRQIRLDAAHGATVPQLCATYHLSERQVRRILSVRVAKDFWSEPW